MRLAIVIALLLALAGCRSDPGLKPFTSDGCSLFPDRALISGDDWCDCCFEHDIAYWRGGTRAEREAADAALRDCVAEKTGDRAFAAAARISTRGTDGATAGRSSGSTGP